MTKSTDHSSSDEHRISLITFSGKTVNIKTWWITEDKFALLDAALGDPNADSLYPREYFDRSNDEIIDAGAHILKGDNEANGSGT